MQTQKIKNKVHFLTIFVIIICIVIFNINITLASVNIPLTISESVGVSRTNEPISSGVPLSRDQNIKSINSLRITDSSGATIPAQFRVLSRYDGTITDSSKPIRVVLADFQTSLSSNNEKTIYLKDDQSGSAGGTNLISEDSNYFTINTGKLIAKISKSKFNIFDAVYIDANNDGQININDPNDKITGSTTGDGVILKYGGTEFSSANGEITTAIIEKNGPLKAVIKIEGLYKDTSGNYIKPPLGDSPLGFLFRIKVFKDKSYLKVDYTLQNENKGWTRYRNQPTHPIYIESLKLKTTLNLANSKTAEFSGYQDSFSSASTFNYELTQDHFENSQNEANNFIYEIKKNSKTVSTGKRYDGSVNLQDSSKGLMVANRWLWQNWPKSVSLTGDSSGNEIIEYYLWPDMPYDHRILGGLWKTHEMIYYFHSADSQFDDETAALKSRLMAFATDTWYAESDFFAPMIPAEIETDYTFPAGEKLETAIEIFNDKIQAKYDPSFITATYAPKTWFDLREERPISNVNGYLNYYGWLAFGDTPRGTSTWGYSAQHYGWDYVTLMNYLRFKDYDLFNLGEEFVSHKADIIIIHDRNAMYGNNEDDKMFNGGHRYEWDALFDFNDEYSESANNAVMHASHTWHKGMILEYFLTGDERYKDVAVLGADHMVYTFINFRKCNIQDCGQTETRQEGRAINVLTDAYKLTGDNKYLNAAYNVFNGGFLGIEAEKNGEPAGWFYYNDGNIKEAACNKEICNATLHYTAVAAEPLNNLYDTLVLAGQTTKADNVAAFALRMGNWLVNSVYTNWEEGPCGVYNQDKTEYRPYTVKKFWKDGYKWKVGEGVYRTEYSMECADLFSLLYKITSDEKWLTLARTVFKDLEFYGVVEGKMIPVKKTGKKIEGFYAQPLDSYMKIGNQMMKPFFYLRTEWQINQGTFCLPGDPGCPDPTCTPGEPGCSDPSCTPGDPGCPDPTCTPGEPGCPITNQCSLGDTNNDGTISILELKQYIDNWKFGINNIQNLFIIIEKWKNGC